MIKIKEPITPFFKTYENVCGYELTSNTTYFINDEDLSYLNFQIKIKFMRLVG